MTEPESALRPFDFAGDFRALPRLVRGPSFLLPAALTIATIAIVFIQEESSPPLVALLTLFVGPIPVGASVLAAILAPRASWLMGGLAALFATTLLFGYIAYETFTPGTARMPVILFTASAIVIATSCGLAIGAAVGVVRWAIAGLFRRARRSPA